MNIPDLPSPDDKGRIVLRPPNKGQRAGGAIIAAVSLPFWGLSWHFNTSGVPWLYPGLALIFLAAGLVYAFSPHQVVLDDDGISAGPRGFPARIAWHEVGQVQLVGKPPRSVWIHSHPVPGQRGGGPLVIAPLAPLSDEETARLILRLAREHGAVLPDAQR